MDAQFDYTCTGGLLRAIMTLSSNLLSSRALPNRGTIVVREFAYRGEIFRVTAHGIAGHEEIFVVHIDKDGVECGETSIDRMTEANDTSAPLEDILVMLCDRLTPDIEVQDPNAPFAWRQGNVVFEVHNGLQAVEHE
jgi:hypothetical protein